MRLSTDLSLSRRWSAEAAAVRRPLALGLMVASGFAGLGYQIVWIRQNIAVEFALHGGFVAGPLSLRRFAGDAPLSTDDHPVVAYRTPRPMS